MRGVARGFLGALLLAALVGGCGGRGFRLLEVDSMPGRVPLNQPVVLRFSGEVLAASVTPQTIRVFEEGSGRPVPGTRRVMGDRIEFHPALPCRSDLADAGLQPDRVYQVEAPGLPRAQVVRSTDGERLVRGVRQRFRTVPADPDLPLFRDPGPGTGGPVRDRTAVPVLNARRGEVDLVFEQPLDPRSLVDAEFLLRFPWSPDSDPELPRFTLELVANGPAARLRLRLPDADGPLPLNPGEEGYQIEVRRAGLRDLGGHPWNGGTRIDIRVQQGNPDPSSTQPAPREGPGQ